MLSSDYGEYKLERISEGRKFWYLVDALIDDKSIFLNNRNVIADAFINGQLYGMTVHETEEMSKRRAWKDPIFCPGSWYLLPCFCIASGETVKIMWTHTRARKNGIATHFIRELGIKCVSTPLTESIQFWYKRGLLNKIE